VKIQPSRLAELSENWFRLNREEMAAHLASDESLQAFDKALLSFEDLEERVYSDHAGELTAALKLCAIEPVTGGKHIRKLLETAALELVDAFECGLRASYEEEINRSEAA
jgi:hypothetical protein